MTDQIDAQINFMYEGTSLEEQELGEQEEEILFTILELLDDDELVQKASYKAFHQRTFTKHQSYTVATLEMYSQYLVGAAGSWDSDVDPRVPVVDLETFNELAIIARREMSKCSECVEELGITYQTI